MTDFTRYDDEEVLHLLHLRDHDGLTAAQAAKATGRSRSSVLGIEKRVRDQCQRHFDLCTKPENQDGGMPARWWAV